MKVFSMFDGVGGFIVGLNNADPELFKTIYSNQFEPGRKSQDAYEVGTYRFPNIEHIPTDVSLITDKKFQEMRQNGVDMIVGGFPCQDYSVARSKKNELGIEGKKGVLFWEIVRATENINPKFLILENVDRLLKAPSMQRGRDFAIMLAAFNKLGYSVEWRVINAAEYGCAQRRRRVFIFVYKNTTEWAQTLDLKYENNSEKNFNTYEEYLFNDGIFARQFPIKHTIIKKRYKFNRLSNEIADISDEFQDGQFWNTGVMRHGYYYTVDTESLGNEQALTLKDILVDENAVAEEFFLDGKKLEKFKYLRGPKKLNRVSANGHKYLYSEGGMSEYDSLDLPGRTMLTSEGSVNRSTHLLKISNRYRLLTPIEAERLQAFPDDWTKYKKNSAGNIVEVSTRMRMFFMGNALVTTIVTRIAKGIAKL